MLMILACGSTPDPQIGEVELAEPEPSYEPTFGEPVELDARYVVMPFAGGKHLQAVELQLEGGETWVRSYRPIPEEFAYVDKRVTVTGRPYTNSPYVQSVGGTHFELETIRLADGETAWDPVPSELPAPAQVRTSSEAQARIGLWAHAVGTLAEVSPQDHGHRGRLTLADGTEIGFWTLEESSLVGSTVTVLGQLREEDGLQMGATQICAGEVEACNMTLDSY